MEHKNKLLAAGLAAMLAAPMALGQMAMGGGMGGGLNFADADKDADGNLSKEELGAVVPENMLDTLFTRWDTDEDGKISADEFENRQASGGGMGMGT